MKKNQGVSLATAMVIVFLVSLMGLRMLGEALLSVQMGAAQWSHEQQVNAGGVLIHRLCKQSLDELIRCIRASPCIARSLNEKFSYSVSILPGEPCQQLRGSTIVGVRYGVLSLVDVTRGFSGLNLQMVLAVPYRSGVACQQVAMVTDSKGGWIPNRSDNAFR